MEVLLEILVEIFVEVIGEFIFVVLGRIFDRVGNSKKGLKITKISVYSTIAVALLVLLVFSLIYKKGVLIALVLGYLLFILLAYYLMFVFKNVLDRPRGSVIIKWFVRVIRYAFLISLIVCASFVLVDQTARTLLYIGSLLGICVFMFIDGYTYAQYVTKKRSNYQNESLEEE